MRKRMLIGVLVSVVVLTGCNGMVKSYEDRENSYARSLDSDMRRLADDFDALWLVDRQSRLTRWELR